MNSTCFLFLTIGAVICTGLFAWKLHRGKQQTIIAFIALALSILLGYACSKGLYFLAKFPEQFDNYGFAGLLRTRPAEFSFVGGALGVVLAVVLTARLLRKPVFHVLDAFAPCGALMAVFFRCSEGLLDPMSLVGVGDFVGDAKLWFFPVAIENTMLYSWFYAVFMMEAAFALIVAVVAFIRSHKGSYAPGRVFLHTAFFLALPQIFSERMLNQCMKWGFVRVEQLLCAVIVFAVILYACVKGRSLRGAFLPAVTDFLCVAVLIWIEFTLDNKLLFGIELSPTACYAVMIATLGCMAALSLWAYARLNKAEK